MIPGGSNDERLNNVTVTYAILCFPRGSPACVYVCPSYDVLKSTWMNIGCDDHTRRTDSLPGNHQPSQFSLYTAQILNDQVAHPAAMQYIKLC